jgi:hypothetical protein
MPADFTITFISPGCSGAGLDIRPEVTKSTMASHRLRLCAARTEIRRIPDIRYAVQLFVASANDDAELDAALTSFTQHSVGAFLVAALRLYRILRSDSSDSISLKEKK